VAEKESRARSRSARFDVASADRLEGRGRGRGRSKTSDGDVPKGERAFGEVAVPWTAVQHADEDRGIPQVGEVLRGMRLRRGMSLKDVASGSGLSVSFLSAVERGQSDISLGRLNRLAQVFNHDIGSLLGYTGRRSTPQFVGERDRLVVDRGEGIDYRVFRLPGLDFELISATFGPHTAFRDAITHEGLDIIYVLSGEIILEYRGDDYPMVTGDCTLYSGAYPHRFRNDSAKPAGWLSIVTGIVY
jgi:transcriptional regulator with XRE-family HTH domain